MKDLGDLRFFFGIEVIRTSRGIWLVQRQYALDMLAKYGMMACKLMLMPLEQNMKLRADLGDEVVDDITMYRKMVGSLIYMTIYEARSQLCGWTGKSVYAEFRKPLGCSETYYEIHQDYRALWSFL